MQFVNGLLTTMFLCAPVLAADPAVRAVYRDDLANEVSDLATRDLEGLVDFYKELHRHPELSLQEEQSARRVAERLEAFGYQVTRNVGGHGVVGVLANGPGPTVLIRGDMDALPLAEETRLPYESTVKVTGTDGRSVGVMHACGHDVHQTCLVGTARILAELRARWSGTVLVVAQPAEEIGTGARAMILDGLFDRFGRANYCLALHVASGHPAGAVAYTAGWALANVDSVDITIRGMGGHGSKPDLAIDPIVAAAQVIVALQTVVSRRLDPTEPGVITVGSIHAGSKHNIIPDEAKLQLTVRSYTEASRQVLLDGIRDVTIHTCRAMGCKRKPLIVVRYNEHTPSTYNDPALAEAAAHIFGKVLGPDKVLKQKPVMGGEDFGRYSKYLEVPGFIFWLGSVKQEVYEASLQPDGPLLPSLHSSKYAPDPAPTIQTGVRCMSSLALALLKKKP